ncbi:MAG: hypothetical protein KKD39_07430 [Candidatus Altiarchaeota archaeon]|nr:hypothetical protein [Candidatus Altiarchaeota archaeon]
MIDVLLAVLALAVATGIVLVLRGGPENSLIGLNVATIAAVTVLMAFDRYYGLAFAKDIGFYLIFPGVFGVMIFSRFILGVKNG